MVRTVHLLVTIHTSAERKLCRWVVLCDSRTGDRIHHTELIRTGHSTRVIYVACPATRETRRAIHVAWVWGAITVAFLTEPGSAGTKQGWIGGAVGGVAIHAVIASGRMLPKKGAALLRVASPAGFVDGRLGEQLRPGPAVRVVTIRAHDLAFLDRMV